MKISDKDFTILIEEASIIKRVKELARELSVHYEDKDPLFLIILNGGFMFGADLVKEVDIPCQLSFVKVSSYSGLESTGLIKTVLGIDQEIAGRNVVVVDDIVDTGLTAYEIYKELKEKQAASVEVAALILKPEAFQGQIPVKYVGFTIPNNFIVGYGLDYNGYGRNLKNIYQIKN